jgi:hypothetical protein
VISVQRTGTFDETEFLFIMLLAGKKKSPDMPGRFGTKGVDTFTEHTIYNLFTIYLQNLHFYLQSKSLSPKNIKLDSLNQFGSI